MAAGPPAFPSAPASTSVRISSRSATLCGPTCQTAEPTTMKSKSIAIYLGVVAQAARGAGAPQAGNPAGSLAISSPGFNTLSRMDASECLRDFSGLIPIKGRPEEARGGPEFIAQRDGFRLHEDALPGFGKSPVGIQAPQVAVILAHLGDAHRERPASPALCIHTLPHHVALHIQNGGFLHTHGRLKVVRSGKAEELGGGDGLGEILGAMVIVLEHADQLVHGGAGNEGSSRPVVELPAGQFVRVRPVRLSGADFLPAHDLLVPGRVGI